MTLRQSVEDRHAATWADAMRRARSLSPEVIARHIAEGSDSGLRAVSYDRSGGRTTRVPCREGCEDGDPFTHSHLVVSDPTGNAATRSRGNDRSHHDAIELRRNEALFVRYASEVLHWVKGERPTTWAAVVALDARLLPGTIQSGIDVDHEGDLYHPIGQVSRAVDAVARIAADHLPREPSQDEQHWTSGLADEDCCAWHLAVHRRYRRPRVVLLHGQPICQDCLALYDLGDSSTPPQWLLEAEVDRRAKPRAWQAALGRWLDELGIARERSA